MTHPPLPGFAYGGLTIILDKPSRFDRGELLSGIAGAYFDNCLVAGGNSAIHKATVDIRTIEHVGEPFLPGTKALLLLGEGSLPMFKEDVTLNEQRGSPFWWNGLPCVATYAPQDAYDRRDYFSGDDSDDDDKDDKETAEGKTTHGATQRKNWRFWMRQDVKKAVRIATTGLQTPTFQCNTWPPFDVVEHLLLTTKGTNLYFDIETDSNLQLTCFGFSVDEGRNVYVVPMLQTHTTPNYYHYGPLPTARLLKALAVCLRDNTVVIHNSSFDLFVLAYRYGIPLVGKVYDTMLAHNRCYIEVEKSLGHCISLYTDLPYHKNEGIFEPHNYQQTCQLYEYNGKDVFGLVQIKSGIDATAKRLGATESVEQVNRMVIPYLTMSLHGTRLDEAAIAKTADHYTRYNAQIERIINILVGHDLNPNSYQQVAKYLYEELGLKRPDKDPTAEKTLLQLRLKKDVPTIMAILRYRGNQKKISKVSLKTKKAAPRYYYGPYNHEGKAPRLTTSWRLGKTITMRLGSSKLLRRWGDNFQNWDKELRKVIVPDEGKCMLQIDQSGAEALIVAYLCRPGQLRDLFLCNINPHCFLALHLFREQFEAKLGRSLAQYTAATVRQLATLPGWKETMKFIKSSDDWPPHERYYYIGKQGNHSGNYDIKARAFRLNTLQKSDGAVALTLDQSQEVLDKRNGMFPELQLWHMDVVRQAKTTNILRNLFGHPRVVTGFIDETAYKELYAFIPQSTVGQITNYAITEFQERLLANDDLLVEAGVDVLNNNHDSMLVQCWDDPKYYVPVAKEMAKHFNRRLVSPRGEEFNMKSEVQYSKTSWKEMTTLDLNTK